MELETVKDKIRKLIAHEQSAKKLGNHDEARMYTATIARLCRKYKLTRKGVLQPEIQMLKGEFECSCGFSISLTISAGAATDALANMMLAPHKARGHTLRQVA